MCQRMYKNEQCLRNVSLRFRFQQAEAVGSSVTLQIHNVIVPARTFSEDCDPKL